jgi:hypothetical protein
MAAIATVALTPPIPKTSSAAKRSLKTFFPSKDLPKM